MAFGFYYPDVATSTDTWVPDYSPVASGSSRELIPRAQPSASAGGEYAAAPQVLCANDREQRTYTWPVLTGSSFGDLKSFFTSSAEGQARTFEVIDESGGTITCRFAMPNLTYARHGGTGITDTDFLGVSVALWCEP